MMNNKHYLNLKHKTALTNMDESTRYIVQLIADILENRDSLPLNALGEHIALVTTPRRDWDKLQRQYPFLGEIAELAVDLKAADDEWEAQEIFQQIINKFAYLINHNVACYPQMTYRQAVEHCKYWADQIRSDGIDLLTTDYSAAIGVSDQLAYPLDMQVWISAERHPLMYKVCDYAGIVDSDHTNRPAWETLLRLIDQL